MTLAVAPVALSRRLTRVSIAYTTARMKVIEARSGQPVAMRRFGEAAPRRTCAAGSTCRTWRLYLVRIDGRPAAAAKLFLHDGVGYFGGRRDRSGFPRPGIADRVAAPPQRRSRRNRARELIYSQAAFGSMSHRNMERIGLRVLIARAPIWTR